MSKQLLQNIRALNEIKTAIREVEAEARINPSMEVGERLNDLYVCLLAQADSVQAAAEAVEVQKVSRPALKLVA